jgi:hypothetical protein
MEKMSLVKTDSAGEICAEGARLERPGSTAEATHMLPVRLRVLAPAEVGEGPGRIAEHAELVVLVEKREQRSERALGEDVIAALWAVAGDVAERPDRLFADIEDRIREEFDEYGHGAGIDDDLGVLRCTRGDVGERPSRFELSTSMKQALYEGAIFIAHLDHGVRTAEELDEALDNAAFDDLLDRGIAFFR